MCAGLEALHVDWARPSLHCLPLQVRVMTKEHNPALASPHYVRLVLTKSRHICLARKLSVGHGRTGTCCSVEPVATLPSCFLSSSSSCVDILEAATGMLKLAGLLAAALAVSSALSLAFCCKY